jgi:hypothetical protein
MNQTLSIWQEYKMALSEVLSENKQRDKQRRPRQPYT